jgi:hypothetical protein
VCAASVRLYTTALPLQEHEVAWAKNPTKSKVRAKVEHAFQVMKLKFGLV